MSNKKETMSRDDILRKMGIDPKDVVKAKNSNSATLTTKGKVRNEIKEGMDKAIGECKLFRPIKRTTTLKAQNDANAKPKVKDFEGHQIVIDNGNGEYEIVVPKLYFETYTTCYVSYLDSNDK